jgi:hypothetical protein
MATFGQRRRIRWITWASTRAISSPDGRLPGRSSDKIGLPDPASKMWIGLKHVPPAWFEQRQLLLAAHHVVSVVDVEHDRCRRA